MKISQAFAPACVPWSTRYARLIFASALLAVYPSSSR